MAKYGQFKYGDEKYGAVAQDGLLVWDYAVDWDGDSEFNGDNEALTMDGLTVDRGRTRYIKANGIGFDRPKQGQIISTHDDKDGRYDPLNTSGAEYPNIEPGKFMRLRVKDLDTGTVYNVATGVLDDVKAIGQDRTKLSAVDGWDWLRRESVSIALSEGVTIDTVISAILSQASWPSIWGTDILAGADARDYIWSDRVNAASAIMDLVDSELGVFRIAANGQAKFQSRNVIDSPVQSIDQANILKELFIPTPWEYIFNSVKVLVHPIIVQAATEIWKLEDVPLIGDGESLVVFTPFKFDDRSVAATNLITPVSTTDFTANTQADGGGVDKTSGFTMVITSTFAETAKVTITNSSGSDAFLTLARLRGDALDSPQETEIRASVTATQPRTFVMDSKWLQDVSFGVDLAEFLSEFLATLSPYPVIEIENRFDLQFAPDIGDKISLTIAEKGIDADFRIGRIRHEWLSPNGQAVKTTFYLEPLADLSTYWQFPTTMGVLTKFAL